jgi:hypothetical protein
MKTLPLKGGFFAKVSRTRIRVIFAPLTPAMRVIDNPPSSIAINKNRYYATTCANNAFGTRIA